MRSVYALICLCLLLIRCSGPSAPDYAERFCACSEALSKAETKITKGKITQHEFDAIIVEHRACLGDDDPLEALKDNPDKLAQFKKEFLTELEKQCPTISRDMGF